MILAKPTLACFALVAVAIADPSSLAASPLRVDWARTYGSDAWRFGLDVAVGHDGQVHLAGIEDRIYIPELGPGPFDAYLLTYNPLGGLEERISLGSRDDIENTRVAIDANGDRLLAGDISTNRFELDGRFSTDIFYTGFQPNGQRNEFIIAGNRGVDSVDELVAFPGGGAILAGYSLTGLEPGGNNLLRDAYIRRVTREGKTLWTASFSTSGVDYATGIAVTEAGDIFASVQTVDPSGGLGLEDVIRVQRYSSEGQLIWSQAISNSPWNAVSSVAYGEANTLYAAGHTRDDLGAVNSGSLDAFVTQLDMFGDIKWTRQFGTINRDVIHDIEVDADGNVYALGTTDGDLSNPTSSGPFNTSGFLAKYNPNGEQQWIYSFPALETSTEPSLALSPDGGIYVGGTHSGGLFGLLNSDGRPTPGGSPQAFVVRFSEIPEPGSCWLLVVIMLGLTSRRCNANTQL